MDRDRRWVWGVIGSVIGFLVSQGVAYYIFHETLTTTVRVEQIRLMRDLSRQFSEGGLFRDIRTAIESCEPLYKSWQGKFSHEEINQYLGFFEDLGYLENQGLLNIAAIDHMVGAYLVEADSHPDVIRFVTELRKNSSQPQAFVEFERLSKKLLANPERSRLSGRWGGRCSQALKGRAE